MEIRTDIEIAQACEKKRITEIAAAAGFIIALTGDGRSRSL